MRTINLRLPSIDPSHHISLFASILEFGIATPQIAVDASQLVARMDRDWLSRSRQPSGICGAALLIAARMNKLRRSIQEIVQVVKIADCTVRKRIEEFKQTGSAGLSIGDFQKRAVGRRGDAACVRLGEGKRGEEEGRAGGCYG